MVKKGEYYRYGIELLNKMENLDINKKIDSNKFYPDTQTAILLEVIKEVEDLKKRLTKLEEKGVSR